MNISEEDIIKACKLGDREVIKERLKSLQIDSELEAEYLAHLELEDEFALNALENQSPEC